METNKASWVPGESQLANTTSSFLFFFPSKWGRFLRIRGESLALELCRFHHLTAPPGFYLQHSSVFCQERPPCTWDRRVVWEWSHTVQHNQYSYAAVKHFLNYMTAGVVLRGVFWEHLIALLGMVSHSLSLMIAKAMNFDEEPLHYIPALFEENEP